MVSSPDLATWTDPIAVMETDAFVGIGNTSVTAVPTGFVMAHDFAPVRQANYWEHYDTHFAFSTDLVNWTSIGQAFDSSEYNSAPTIRYIDGLYYLFVVRLIQNGPVYPYYVTYVHRSTDLMTWEKQRSKYAVISPDGDPQDGSATTDLDLVEYNGVMYITYLSGDQQTWGLMRYATFQGTVSQFVALFF
jgi:hypothetical protein